MKSVELKANITREIRKITEDELIHVNDNFIKRCQKCVDSDDVTSNIAYNKIPRLMKSGGYAEEIVKPILKNSLVNKGDSPEIIGERELEMNI
ncbi:hypothetical protein ANN_19423 [Periplaneta americana]|uniref:Uncharacterized protein n=1 Tax=Periplaneta americana TaxID=6978 RepID=A0ABQ8SA60_PERAM|nr:hypothetical protein ANN_19423 [Periplaneta americana]